MDPLRVRILGRVPYREASDLQQALAGSAHDYVLLLEHPATITLGRSADPAHVLVDPSTIGAEVVETDRGGDVTLHAPGPARGLRPRHDRRGPTGHRRARRPPRRRASIDTVSLLRRRRRPRGCGSPGGLSRRLGGASTSGRSGQDRSHRGAHGAPRSPAPNPPWRGAQRHDGSRAVRRHRPLRDRRARCDLAGGVRLDSRPRRGGCTDGGGYGSPPCPRAPDRGRFGGRPSRGRGRGHRVRGDGPTPPEGCRGRSRRRARDR